MKGLQSLQLGAIGGLIGASINEFSTDGTLSQNSDVKVPTQRAVKTYVDAISSSSGDFTVGNDLTVTGNMTVNGTTSTVNSTNTTISDARIELGTGTSGSATKDAKIIIERVPMLTSLWDGMKVRIKLYLVLVRLMDQLL